MAIIETPSLALQKLRKYATPQGEFYLAVGAVARNGQPLVSVTRWDADKVFDEIRRQYSGQDWSLQPESLYQSWSAAEHDPIAKQSIFTFPAKWQSHFVLPSNTPTETDKYVLRAGPEGKALLSSGNPRLLNPAQRFREGDREIVIGTVFDLPFELRNGFYNGLEDLDPETGFLKQLHQKGKYYAWFLDDQRLHASLLDWNGNVLCGWEPWSSSDHVGLRGVASTGNEGQIPESLLEKDIVVETEDALLPNSHEPEKQEADRRSELLTRLNDMEAHYRDGLRQLSELRTAIEKE